MFNTSKTISRLLVSVSLLACLSNPVFAMEPEDKHPCNHVVKKLETETDPLEIYDYSQVVANPDILNHIFLLLDDEHSQLIIPQISKFFDLIFQKQLNEKLKLFPIRFEHLNPKDQKFVSTLFGNKASCTKPHHFPVLNFINSFQENHGNLYKVYNGLPENMPHPFVMTFMTNAVEFRFVNVLGFSYQEFVKKLAAFPPEKLNAIWSTGASIFQNVSGCYIHEGENGCLNHLSNLSVEQLKAFGRNHFICESILPLHKYEKGSIIALQAFSSEQLDALGYNPSIYNKIDRSSLPECLSALSALSVAQIHALGRNAAIFQNVKSENIKECFTAFKALSVEQIDSLGQNYPLIFTGISYLSGFPTTLASLPEDKLNVLIANPWILKKIKSHPEEYLKALAPFSVEQLQTLARNEVILQDIDYMKDAFHNPSAFTVDKIDALGRNGSILKLIKSKLDCDDTYTLTRVLSALSTCSIEQLDILGSNSSTLFQGTENLSWERYIKDLATLSVEQLKTLAPHGWIFEEIQFYPSKPIKMLQGLSVEQLDALVRNASILEFIKKKFESDDMSYRFSDLLSALPTCSVEHIDILGSNTPLILQGLKDLKVKEHIIAVTALSLEQLKTLVSHDWLFEKIKGHPVNCLKSLKGFSPEQLESLGSNPTILKDIECDNEFYRYLKTLSAYSAEEIATIGKNADSLIPALFQSGGPKINAVKELKRLLEQSSTNQNS